MSPERYVVGKGDPHQEICRAGTRNIKAPPGKPSQHKKNVEADQALIEQAINNLVENAIKYTDSGGKVKIIIRSEDENVIYVVQDNGIGISPADQQNLFEKFYRISSKGNQEERGSGLGLAIVKSIAVRHGGDVHVESQLGDGSTFYLVIPMKQAKSESTPN